MVIRKGDFYLSIVLAALCIFVFVESSTFPREAATFPKISSGVLFVLAALLMISSLKGTKPKPDAAESKGFKYANAGFLVAGLVAYALLLQFLGYIITTLALVFYTIFIMGYRDKKGLIVTTLVSVVLCYLVFHSLLDVPLPDSFVARLIAG